MVKKMRRSRGFRNKTRRTLKAKNRTRVTITKRLKELDLGTQVVIALEPSFQDGMPHPRYQGTIGKITEKRGRAYLVSIKDKNKPKILIATPEHVKPFNNTQIGGKQ